METEEENNHTIAVENSAKKRRLEINFDELFGEDHDKPDQEIVVVSAKSQRKKRRKLAKETEDDPPPPSGIDFSVMSEAELKNDIDRFEKNLVTLAVKLPDGGAKLKAKLQSLKEELERRQNRGSQEVSGDECKKRMESESFSIKGSLAGSKQASSEAPSEFASHFLNKLDIDIPKNGQNTTNQASAFGREISCINPCNKSKRAGGKLRQSKKANPGLHFKDFAAWRPGDSSPRNGGSFMRFRGDLAGKFHSTRSNLLQRQKSADSSIDEGDLADKFQSTRSNLLQRQNSADSSIDEDDSQALASNCSKEEETVVLVDEEETEPIERKQDAEELPSRLSDGKIYYPSREDSDPLEIFRSELKCLEPGECLTSTIMNFYVRYLQGRCSDASQFNFYFFNTYFYSKLQTAVENKQIDKEAFFSKFRRWWKGVDLFGKAYIFLPINEDNHWSLVIVCIPDREGDSGVIILHLDSLGLHSSASIFDNIKSLLINEWRIVSKEVGPFNVPLPEKIWTNLPRRIEHKSITVPRQNNDYDCGLFVLYYIEVFIKDAPERLSKQDCSMFGKNWFKPHEASSLRKKIKGILQEKFRETLEQDNRTFVPVCLSSKAEIPKTVDWF